jgi:hypothetical protein
VFRAKPLASAAVPPTLSHSNVCAFPQGNSASNELDLNDLSTLEIYSGILLFEDDRMRDGRICIFRTHSSKQRRIVHLVSQKLGVYHYSVGEGEDRYVVATQIDPEKVRPIIWLRRTPVHQRLQGDGNHQ